MSQLYFRSYVPRISSLFILVQIPFEEVSRVKVGVLEGGGGGYKGALTVCYQKLTMLAIGLLEEN